MGFLLGLLFIAILLYFIFDPWHIHNKDVDENLAAYLKEQKGWKGNKRL